MQPVLWKSACYLAFSLGMFLVPAWLAGHIAQAEAPGFAGTAAMALCVCLAGHGLHLLAYVGHEGIHINLLRNRGVSALIAIACSAMVPSFFAVGYALTHWAHHKYTNRPEDPDLAIYGPLRSFWARVFLARSRASRVHLRNTIACALGRPDTGAARPPFADETLIWLARLNLVVSATYLAAYATCAVRAPEFALWSLGMPTLAAYVFSGLRPYVEHSDTTVAAPRSARSFSAALYTLLFFGANYHLEHHLYPGVPCYNLPRLHRELRQIGWFAREGSPIDPGALSALRYPGSRFQYGFEAIQVR
jgi:fatty acid desaturase